MYSATGLNRHARSLVSLAAITMCLAAFLALPDAMAKDTDIYAVNTKQNCYILMDNSGSMDFGVYEHTVDYGAMFDYLFTLYDSTSYYDYIYDTINYSSYFYNNHEERRKIYLWKGRIGVTVTSIDGQTVAFTGDAADPNYLWFMSDLIDTHTLIDDDGNLADDGTGQQRVTVDTEGHVLLDGHRLPLGQDIKLHDFQTLYNGSRVDNGFGGLLNAPGYYFSGYEGVTPGNLNVAEDGDQDIFFFVTGNWVNMQAMYNLHYTTNNPVPAGARRGDPAWKYELFPIGSESWAQQAYSLKYPDPANGDPYYAHPTGASSCPVHDRYCWSSAGDITYVNNLRETDTARTITHPGAAQIQVHFSMFDVENDGRASTFRYDYVALYDGSGNLVAKYDNDNNPTAGDGWSATVPGDTVVIKLYSDRYRHDKGYEIDKYRVTYHTDSYLMQNRLDVAKDAMTYVVDAFKSKINWGFATFNYLGYTADGANIRCALNPNLNDDANRQAILQQIQNVQPKYGTPLGEALQDIFEKGYYIHRHSLDNLLCRKNYVIAMTDGFPSGDNDWSRISGVGTFTDADGDGWTEDPYQYSSPPDDYYDDVAHWMYTHSWLDKSEVEDPANSYVNVITHHIAFGARHPLLQDAAGESGGEYITAYNKEQLVSAFYSLSLLISEAVSFTAPVVSVDAANKVQSGDELYMGLFLPKDNSMWVGNLKKFWLGDGSTERPDLWMIYDGDNQEAVDSTGSFLDNTAAIWADDDDANDHDNYGSSDVQEDGAGEVLTERVAADLDSGDYYERPIYTSKGGVMVRFNRTNISASDLGVADDATRDKLVNYVYGYTYDADASGNPTAARSWALGAIIHSRPVVIDYYNPSDLSCIQRRLIAVGANDGMLHVFDDSDGSEVFAFIPEDLLSKLQLLPDNNLVDMVDGHITVYRRDNQPKYLIFGERRGGSHYWCLDISDTDPANWSVAWDYTNSEILQSWSQPMVASIQTGAESFKDVLILTGGYDPEEDHYPEPFEDLDNNGTPYDSDGNIDSQEWSHSNSEQDVDGNNQYDMYNPDKNEYGRGIFVVDIDDPSSTTSGILPFSITYGTTDVTTGTTQRSTSMKYCFPASPSIVTSTESYYDSHGDKQFVGNLLEAVYAVDIYANIYKVTYRYNDGSPAWNVQLIFSANPGSTSASGTLGGGADANDQGRKAFYSPAVSWGGSGLYFDPGNYHFDNTTFDGQNSIATLYMGTGDREHPAYTMVRNRFYAIYDDSSVSAEQMRVDINGDPVRDAHGDPIYDPVDVTSVPYTEDDLLNLTCDELGDDTSLGSSATFTKEDLQELLTDDPTYDTDPSTTELELALEEGALHEDDAKGWYIILEDQGDSTVCSHCSYEESLDTSSDSSRDNHRGEKVLSKPVLYYNTVYFTTYQPSYDDPCNPQGNGFSYALDYEDGSAALNLNLGNDGTSTTKDISDRYRKYVEIYGIPSGFEIITRQGHAAALASMGGMIIGGGETDGTHPGYEIPSPGMGLEFFYWFEGITNR